MAELESITGGRLYEPSKSGHCMLLGIITAIGHFSLKNVQPGGYWYYIAGLWEL